MAEHNDAQVRKLQQAEPTTADKIFASLNKAAWFKNAGRSLFYALQDIMLGDVLSRNKELKDKHAGQRCFLLLTGPSIHELDFSALASEITIGCNLLFYHKNFAALNLKYFALVEPFYGRLFGKKHIEESRVLYREVDAALANSNATLLLSGSARSFFKQNGFFQKKNVYYVLPGERMTEAQQHTCDLTRRISFAGGVIFSAIAAAIYMGFREIYIFGAGKTYHPRELLHFYDPVHSKELPMDEIRNRIGQFAESRGLELFKIHEDEKYVWPTYIENVWAGDDGYYDLHEIVKKFAEERGVRIINVTPDGLESPVYEKITLGELMQNVLHK